MTGVYVVDTTETVDPICRTILAYENALSVSGAVGSAADPDYPLVNAFDHSYNTEWSPDLAEDPTSVQYVFSFGGSRVLNYFGIISKNAEESGLSVLVETFNISTGLYEEAENFGSMTDGLPVMVYFGDVDTIYLRVTLSYTAKPYIMSMFSGRAIVFPRTLSLGAQPAHLSNIDEVEIFYADEGLNIAPSRRLVRGYQLKGSINYVKMSLIETFWKEYANHVKDVKTIFFMWNDKKPTEVIYGVQVPDRLTKPSYKTSLFSQVDFDIVGWA